MARKEVRFIARDPQLLVLQLAFPPLLLLVFGWTLSASVKEVRIGVADRDGSANSRALLRELTSTPYFPAVSVERGERALADGTAMGALDIRPGFAREISRGRRPPVQLLLDGSDVASVRAAQSYLDAFEREMAARLEPSVRPPVALLTWFNPASLDAHYFVPGVLALLVFAFPAVLSALSIVREKEGGTWAALSAAPIGDGDLLFGKLAPYFVQALAMSGLILLVGFLVFGLPFRGSALLFLAGTLAFVVASVALGGVISTLAASEEDAWLYICLIVLLPAFVLSGFIYPLSSMPEPARIASAAFPVRFYLEFIRGVLLKGAGLEALRVQLGALIGFAALATLAAAVLLRRSRRRPA